MKKLLPIIAVGLISGCDALSDLPGCDSTEAKDIILSVLKEKHALGLMTSKACILGAGTSSAQMLSLELFENNICQLPGKVATDLSTEFTNYTVKSESKSKDGLSVQCEIATGLKRKSAMANTTFNFDFSQIRLAIYKKSSEGTRRYEYSGL